MTEGQFWYQDPWNVLLSLNIALCITCDSHKYVSASSQKCCLFASVALFRSPLQLKSRLLESRDHSCCFADTLLVFNPVLAKVRCQQTSLNPEM